ncbi:MAG: aminopeptidase P family N-terminal domain-containing protein, partial [Armatimonadetes bacterium]|nr:aminopeptidase P family N-terminal domain-containing protein [Anaerolineae bacterium]
MHGTQRARTTSLLTSHGIDRALFTHPDSVRWLTGFAPPLESGVHQFAGAPPLVWYAEGAYTLLIVDGFAHDTAADLQVVRYPGYSYTAPLAGTTHFAVAFEELVTRSKGKLGVEEQHTTLLMFGELTVDFIAIDRWLVPLRMVKTPHELTILRRNFALTDIGHTAARAATMPGKREIDVWLEIHSAISQVAGYPVRLG